VNADPAKAVAEFMDPVAAVAIIVPTNLSLTAS